MLEPVSAASSSASEMPAVEDQKPTTGTRAIVGGGGGEGAAGGGAEGAAGVGAVDPRVEAGVSAVGFGLAAGLGGVGIDRASALEIGAPATLDPGVGDGVAGAHAVRVAATTAIPIHR